MSGTKLERGQDPWILCPKQCAGVTVSSRASGLGRLALRKLFRTLGGSWGNVEMPLLDGADGGGGKHSAPRGPGCPSGGGNRAKGVAPARKRRISQGGGEAGPGSHGGRWGGRGGAGEGQRDPRGVRRGTDCLPSSDRGAGGSRHHRQGGAASGMTVAPAWPQSGHPQPGARRPVGEARPRAAGVSRGVGGRRGC